MLKVFEYLPTAINLANDQFASGFGSLRTGQESNMGGLVLGDYFDCDALFAQQQSAQAGPLLFEGRYRRIYVDPLATAANVARGKTCYVVPGVSLQSVLILTAGSGQTPGTYTVVGTGGGGSGASIQVVVAAGGTVTANPTVISAGSGYTSAPTFTLASGGTVATFQAQMLLNTYRVTTADISGVNPSQPRGLFLNTITPGNYGWIQENGIATVLQAATVTSATVGAVVTPVAGGNGTSQATVSSTAPTVAAIGTAIDAPIANAYYRILMDLPVWNG